MSGGGSDVREPAAPLTLPSPPGRRGERVILGLRADARRSGGAAGAGEDRFDLGAQMSKVRVEVGDAGVEEEDLARGDFAGAGLPPHPRIGSGAGSPRRCRDRAPPPDRVRGRLSPP